MVMSGSQRSKEDDVQKISMSVFVTNFPDGYGAKDLWNTCKLYGHVVNIFIPDRRTKVGKRFGFARFIKVFDIDRLINNLCTVWVGRNKIHANVERVQREPLHKQSNNVNNKGTNNVNHGAKGNQVQNVGMEECLNMVLDETCLNHEDFSLCLPGNVKEFASLTNLKVWSRNTFSRIASRWGTLLNREELEEEGYHSNKICIRTKLKTVVFDSFKMVYRSMTCWVRAIEVPGWVPDFEEDGEEGYDANDGSHEDDMYGGVSENLKDVEGESDREEVPETNFEEVPDKSIFEENSVRQNDVHSEDPFGIYEVLNKKRVGKNIDDKHEDSLKYPPGFTPNEEGDVHVEKVDNWSDENRVNDGQEDGVCVGQHVHERVEVSNDTHESTCSGHFKKSEVPLKSGSILELIDDLVDVGKTMGYDMTGCIKNMEEIIESQGTKMKKIDHWCIKRCWGNFTFDYEYSESVSKSEGILCVWDPNMFQKINDTVSNYFIMVRGVWVSSGKRLLIISVYAPLDLREKKMLWDYLSFVIGNWDGEVVIMGDFNEVRDISERFGSIFNKLGAEAFNSFIVNAGLVEVPLGGCSVTWCHNSAKKMSKLDRFLIFDNLMCSCPSISSTSLDRFLSDHQPIITREAHYDYGPIPFNKFMNKLKYMKEKIRIWARLHKESLNSRKSILKAELTDLDGVIDKEEGSDADGYRRREVVRFIQEVEKVDVMEVAIEGDENSKYYHAVLNKKKGRLTIRGVVDGIWMESPHLVKHEFFEHFKNRFEKPNKSRILLERDFVKRISLEHNDDLEREVSNEEIKRAVWDCGIDKAPGPDGFTFGNSSFVTLIPKVPNANMVKDFRPISLIGSLYKVIAKVLANSLVMVLDDIVDEIQSAFVTDRQILDGPFIFNEIVHWCKNKKKQSVIFKVDFEKAYDSVRWDFIDDILRRFSFGDKWCKWIQSCFYSSRGSVLVNESPTNEFQFHKGLKQGDPLSPFLYILVMESLHVSFQRVLDAGLFNGIKLDSSLQISHLFYADDAIFMGQ
nr:RNA-directed DNA polymerase, eukaryota [Tanacetum cinerariifolium]